MSWVRTTEGKLLNLDYCDCLENSELQPDPDATAGLDEPMWGVIAYKPDEEDGILLFTGTQRMADEYFDGLTELLKVLP